MLLRQVMALKFLASLVFLFLENRYLFPLSPRKVHFFLRLSSYCNLFSGNHKLLLLVLTRNLESHRNRKLSNSQRFLGQLVFHVSLFTPNSFVPCELYCHMPVEFSQYLFPKGFSSSFLFLHEMTYFLLH